MFTGSPDHPNLLYRDKEVFHLLFCALETENFGSAGNGGGNTVLA